MILAQTQEFMVVTTRDGTPDVLWGGNSWGWQMMDAAGIANFRTLRYFPKTIRKAMGWING